MELSLEQLITISLYTLIVLGLAYFGYKQLYRFGFVGKKLLAGLAPGKDLAQLGVWSWWPESSSTNALMRVNLSYEGPYDREKLPTVSFSFLPLEKSPSWESLEYPRAYRELLVGSHRLNKGKFRLELLFFDGATQTLEVPVSKALELYRGYGKGPYFPVTIKPIATHPDEPSFATLSHSEMLKKNEEAIEKKRLAEEAAAKRAKELEELAKAAASGGTKKAKKEKKNPNEIPPLEVGNYKIGLFFGSTTGNTGSISSMIQQKLGDKNVMIRNITDTNPKHLEQFPYLIFGVPTWHIGEVQDDWAEFLPYVKDINLKGKKLAIFGLGDGAGYPDTYVTAMRDLWNVAQPLGAQIVGLWPTAGYVFKKSTSIENGKFLGLVIDIENQNDKTEDRVSRWVTQIKGEFGL